jgi:hypothetical protein
MYIIRITSFFRIICKYGGFIIFKQEKIFYKKKFLFYPLYYHQELGLYLGQE